MMKRNILFLILLLPLTLVGQGKGGKFTIQGTMTIAQYCCEGRYGLLEP